MPLQKLNAFTKKVQDLADKPNATMTAAEVKAQFDAAPDEVRVYLNQLIDALKSTAEGDSGADNISVTAIADIAGTTVQELLESLKALDDSNKAYLLGQIQGIVLGQIPDNSITLEKLAFSIASTASDVSLSDEGNYYTSENTEGALQEVGLELDTLKSDTDNKVLSVRDAIVGKGGTVTQVGEVPTASELVEGVSGLPTANRTGTPSLLNPTNLSLDNTDKTLLTISGTNLVLKSISVLGTYYAGGSSPEYVYSQMSMTITIDGVVVRPTTLQYPFAYNTDGSALNNGNMTEVYVFEDVEFSTLSISAKMTNATYNNQLNIYTWVMYHVL
ncbi:hypothetical protein [Paenisporosarcina cavernae]|uniref:Uncharacterized protein n=1 Tax=Paenisporosarcina cavernae TaxID=2320858 RepID=A0A385YTK5_9BACL|nr:hypothetical protein [Paenisporosarcina cavernae]AYC29642.1 hypothetical protein D3873_06975 [Paenisporosarcina cavernae]AYC30006.1 hypothetical protein D3873_09025 [Paenisporosarcina cavernae]